MLDEYPPPQFLCLVFSSKIRKLQWCEIAFASSPILNWPNMSIEDHFIFIFFHCVYQLQFPLTPFLLFPSSPSSHHHAFFKVGKASLAESHKSRIPTWGRTISYTTTHPAWARYPIIRNVLLKANSFTGISLGPIASPHPQQIKTHDYFRGTTLVPCRFPSSQPRLLELLQLRSAFM